MFLKREREGYLEIQGGAGLTPEEAALGPPGTLPVHPDKKLQLVTLRCAHCPRQVILNPLRTRERGHCFKCDRYLCDPCATKQKLGIECRPLEKAFDDHLTKQARLSNG